MNWTAVDKAKTNPEHAAFKSKLQALWIPTLFAIIFAVAGKGISGVIVAQINISISSGYTNIKVNHSVNYHFDFDVSTKYANFKSEAPLEYSSRVETQSTKSYKGYYKKSGANKMTISSSYGNVNLNISN